MTEKEWFDCTDPQLMVEFIREKATDRKLRLSAIACCRSVWHLLPDRRSRKTVEIIERYADGLVDAKKLRAVWGDARWAAQVATRDGNSAEGIRWVIAYLADENVQFAFRTASSMAYLARISHQ